jgi:Rps23 Pro-64 3,4-dihydroxylase Tpa1-like proline 4-hydroxylase
MKKLFEINPDLDRGTLARRYAEHGRVQVRDVLTHDTATEIRQLLLQGTPWSMAILGPESQPQSYRHDRIVDQAGKDMVNRASMAAHGLSARGDYAFRYAHYPIVDAMHQKWEPNGPHEILLEHLNAPDFIELARALTGIPELVKADAQATLFAANHYLGRHIDSHVAQGWRVAYVLNLAPDDWHPDWGGYLMFLDDDGDVVEGFRPRFNALNLFAVPQSHLVSYVPPFAPVGRFAITGWLSDR